MNNKNKTSSISKLKASLFEGNQGNIVLTFILLTLYSAANVGIAYIMQLLLDAASQGHWNDLFRAVALSATYLIVFFLVQLVLRWSRNRSFVVAMKNYKSYILDKLIRSNVIKFNEKNSGTYISLLTNDADTIQNGFLGSMYNIYIYVLYFLFSVTLMFYYSWEMAIIVIVLSVVSILAPVIFSNRLTQKEVRQSEQNKKFTSVLKDLLNGLYVIKAFHAEPEFSVRMHAEVNALEDARNQRRKTEEFLEITSGSISNIIQIGVFILGAYWTIQGDMTVGVVIAFVQLMNYIVAPIQGLPVLLSRRKAAKAILESTATLIDEVALSPKHGENLRIEQDQYDIRFKNVSFGYDETTLALSNLNAVFEHGKSYAIVGPTGSGKSTLLRLILGEYDEYTGSITIANREVRDLSIDAIAEICSINDQDVFLFDASIQDNLTLYKKFPDDQLALAVRNAGLSTVIAEKGLDYSCGENGRNLSGGEKQRTAIARALLNDFPVLLFDEPTSALDHETSREIIQLITSLKGKTKIVVTHEADDEILSMFDYVYGIANGQLESDRTG